MLLYNSEGNKLLERLFVVSRSYVWERQERERVFNIIGESEE